MKEKPHCSFCFWPKKHHGFFCNTQLSHCKSRRQLSFEYPRKRNPIFCLPNASSHRLFSCPILLKNRLHRTPTNFLCPYFSPARCFEPKDCSRPPLFQYKQSIRQTFYRPISASSRNRFLERQSCIHFRRKGHICLLPRSSCP